MISLEAGDAQLTIRVSAQSAVRVSRVLILYLVRWTDHSQAYELMVLAQDLDRGEEFTTTHELTGAMAEDLSEIDRSGLYEVTTLFASSPVSHPELPFPPCPQSLTCFNMSLGEALLTRMFLFSSFCSRPGHRPGSALQVGGGAQGQAAPRRGPSGPRGCRRRPSGRGRHPGHCRC